MGGEIGLSVNLILLLFLTHTLFPRARTATSRFFRLSYYDPEANVYNRGPDDLYFVAFAIVIFTALRAATMDYILKPYAQWKGLNKRKTTRFSEQAWILIYDSFFWSVGMVRIFSIPPDYFFFVEPARSESVHKKMKQKLMYTNTVHLRQFRLFFQSERTLDELSYSFHVTHHEVVLFTAIWFLAAANHRRQHRRTKEGSLADVHAPHFHMCATAHKLRNI